MFEQKDYSLSPAGAYKIKIIDLKQGKDGVSSKGIIYKKYVLYAEYTHEGKTKHVNCFINDYCKVGTKTYNTMKAFGLDADHPQNVHEQDWIGKEAMAFLQPGEPKSYTDKDGKVQTKAFMNVVGLNPLERTVPNIGAAPQSQQAQPVQYQQPQPQPQPTQQQVVYPQQTNNVAPAFLNQPAQAAPVVNTYNVNQPVQQAPAQASQPQSLFDNTNGVPVYPMNTQGITQGSGAVTAIPQQQVAYPQQTFTQAPQSQQAQPVQDQQPQPTQQGQAPVVYNVPKKVSF